MSDRDGTMNTNPDNTLATALRALPDAAPQPDLWPDLARTLAQRRRPHRWRYALPTALAAGLALAVLIPRLPTEQPASPTVPASVVKATPTAPDSQAASKNSADELADLHQRSQSLERWIAGFAHAPQDSRDLMAAVEVEDLIGLVDVQLGAAHGDDDGLSLWRQRVALLEDLATIRSNAFAVAANDDGAFHAAPTSLNRLN